MKIGIIGTRGIPNHYGGFEQFAEYLSAGLVERGHEVTVYNSHTHPYQESEWNGVSIIHCNDPEHKMGTVGQFFYDRNCIRDSRKRDFDIILQLGYTSSSVWGRLLPRKQSIVTTNMDGLEWKRSKYSKKVQRFLQYAEKLGVKHSDYLIADSVGIQLYLQEKYQRTAVFIPYGAHLFEQPDSSILDKYEVTSGDYNMLIARLEPENNIQTILDGMRGSNETFLVVGKHDTPFGIKMKERYKEYSHIRFVGGIYDLNDLNNLRYHSRLYFHGHSVGGTNPSLLEAMASNALICAHNNIFNESVLGRDSFYFSSAEDIKQLNETIDPSVHTDKIEANREKIQNQYSWDRIIEQYEDHFKEIFRTR
jgi:glycosyltransferase involved in cell wall biosynthesis